jgi:hypothetical protein
MASVERVVILLQGCIFDACGSYHTSIGFVFFSFQFCSRKCIQTDWKFDTVRLILDFSKDDILPIFYQNVSHTNFSSNCVSLSNFKNKLRVIFASRLLFTLIKLNSWFVQILFLKKCSLLLKCIENSSSASSITQNAIY